jgi:hypothetical protein
MQVANRVGAEGCQLSPSASSKAEFNSNFNLQVSFV